MTEMNILFLADPNSIHDIKWITYFSNKHNCYLITRNLANHTPINNLSKNRINHIGKIKDFSTLRFWKNKKEANKIGSIIKTHQIDIFHILYTEPNILWAIYKPQFKIPIIATNRGSDILLTINNTFKKKSFVNYFVSKNYKKAFAQCDKITCTSNSQIDIVKSLKLSKHITMIKTGIDIKNIDSTKKNEILTHITKPYVLFPRNMGSVYNHELSLEAIKVLPNSIKSKFDFVFIDADSNSRDYVAKINKIISSIAGTHIRFLPKLSHANLVPLIQNASLAVMTNLSDGSPVSAMEIMYLETPLLMSPLKYDKEIFGEVSKFNNFNPTSVAESIEKELLKQPKLNKKLGILKNIIKNTCDRNNEMKKLDTLYKTLT